ncbi:YadA-like family protein [Megasphaera sp. WILCCON 0056]|uniref:YadA-like family protein n=1 Tax=Megasphaera sp. WILCCON 0056 TaxID=3345340 RepID=UPI003A80C5F7
MDDKAKKSLKKKSVYTDEEASSYVSVGGTVTTKDTSGKSTTSPIRRRISNVAGGVEASDAATVGQLQTAIDSIGTTGWKLRTNSDDTKAATITSGTTVDFSPAVDGKNGTADHSNVTVSNTGSNVKIGLNRNIVLGEATSGNGGSLNVYSDSTEASNLGNRVSIDGSTVSVNYGSEEGTSGTKRGVVLGVGEDRNHNAQGYIAFNNIDPKGKIDSTYLHSATDAPDNLKGRLVYSNTMSGTEYIANLDDGITFTGDVQKEVPNGSTQTPTKLNTTLNITGGATTEKDLTDGNIGVVSTPALEKKNDDGTTTQTQESKLEIKLNKDLKGITSITSQTTATDGTTTAGAKIDLGANGTTISGGDVNVSNHKVTGLAEGTISAGSTDAITGKQLYDAKNALTVKKGWGIKITDNGSDGKTIELERNLGKNYGVTKDSNSKGKVEFEATGNNSLILGGSAIEDGWYSYPYPPTRYLDHAYGTFQADSVLVGGENNATGTKDEKNSSREKGSVVVGGRYNTASGYYTLINGGSHNITNGDYSAILGGYKNEVQKSDWAGYSTIVGGAYNIASGTGATAVGGGDDVNSESPIKNKASGSYSTTVGGKGNEASGKLSVTVGGEQNKADGWETVVIGGFNNEALSYYGNQSRGKQPFTEGAIVVGGQQNKNSGRSSSIFGGISNLISINASTASIVGGASNFASGSYTTVGGGQGNVVLGYNSTAFGGYQSIVNGSNSTGIAGGSTEENANLSLAAGYQSTVTEDAIGWEYLSVTEEKYKELMTEMQSGKMSGYYQYAGYSDGKYRVLHYKDISTALGYQATADESGTIALGHDKGDTFLTYKWKQKAWKDGNSYYTRNINTGGVKEISEEEYQKLQNSDGTWNDYTISPNVERGTYDTAYYNRLVKAADGQDAHDVVVREQLTPYTKSDATNIGANLKTYTVGNDGETITEADATAEQKTANKDAWGKALGAGTLSTADAAKNSDQLVTGKTLYNYDAPVAETGKTLTYVSANNTTGQNLSALDAQVAANTSTLNNKTHNIKYYSVNENLPKVDGYSNEGNDGAKGMGSIAAGLNTHADGIASTVAGSYSGVINQGTAGGYDLRGATALSYGTFNINQNTDATKEHSGVANSIVGQANATTDSNAAIIYGAGNTVTNSYRAIDTSKFDLSKIQQDLAKNDAAAVAKDLQDAVPTSGGQVMVMGGGNSVDNAYMTQVTGVGNTVTGSGDAYSADSSQLNYVEGFYTTLTNGKNDYLIGAHNTVTGDTTAQNQSNIVFGDNHTLTNTKNAVIIGSSDTQMNLVKGDNATAIGHNASAQRDALAVGVNTEARGNAVALGTYSTAHNNSIAIGTKATAVSSQNLAIGWEAHIGNIKTDDEKIKNAIALGSDSQVRVNDLLKSDNNRGVLSIGDTNKERRIIHVRAGVNDTDAVNVSQLKSAQNNLTDKGLKFAANSGDAYTAKLGTTVKIQGTAKKAGHEYTVDNLTTEIGKDGTITIMMDKNISADKIAVNGKDGKDAVSISGKDGVGHIGLTGPAGTNGMKGADGKPGTSIDISVKNGYNTEGKDGKDGINGEKGVDGTSLTRIVYEDANGEHQVATMEDGMKFKGDDTTVISKKLNNTLDIIGGADSTKLTDKNIGVNSTDKGQLKVQLAKDLQGITSISNQTTTGEGESQTTTGAKITLGSDGNVDVNNGKITNVNSALDGVKDEKGNAVTIATATGDALKNAANLGDLQKVYNDISAKADKASASHTALTVEGGTAAGTKDDQNKDVYAGKNILLHESTDEKTGKVTYDLKLAKDINIGKPGKDGEDGKIGIDGRDGHIGLNGSDGITVRGLDGKDGAPGKDGVTITGPKGADGTDGKVGISGTDGKDAVSISGKDGVGHIGLTGPAGTNGKDGTNAVDITVKNGYDGANGINGKNGVDGTSLTRIVYEDANGEHQVATMEDGMKFKGDDTTVISKKLNNTLDIIGGAKGDLTEGNIGVNSTKEGKLKVQLAKDLTGMNSTTYTTTTGEGESATTSTTVVNGNGLTITNGPSITNNGVNAGNKTITNVGSGADASGSYTNTTNAANIGDVQNIVKNAVDSAADTTNQALAGKANVDASNIGINLKNADGSAASAEDQKANAEKWGSAIGTGEIKADDGRMVTGKTVYNEVRPTTDGNYVKKDKTTGENLSALDTKIGSLDKNGNYIKKDDSVSKNLSTLDTQVKTNADAIKKNSEDITNINKSISSLDQNTVKYDDSNKSKVTLAGKDGTTITNVKDGTLSDSSTDAVNGKQLYNEQQAREAADKAISDKVTNNTNEITKIKNGDFTDASKTAIHNIAKDAVEVVDGTNTTVTKTEGTDMTPTKYAVNVEGKGKVASGDTGLISGDTLYKEVHVDKDGSYVKGSNTVGQNLSALDTGLKTTSDLIHTNDKGDTIQIGGNSTATKIDVSGKDANGNTTSRVITGVVSDASDPNSAANVGYVNGLTAANTQQIYRDMNNAYSRLDTNINRAAAGSNALAALHPLDFDPADKASFAVGYGHYHNANAAAVGAFYQPNANTMVNMGISLGNGDPGFNAGVSFKIGKGSAYNGVSKAEMAQTIHDQAAEISTIKANDAAKDKRIDALEKENQEMKKQIQEILARLNG